MNTIQFLTALEVIGYGIRVLNSKIKCNLLIGLAESTLDDFREKKG